MGKKGQHADRLKQPVGQMNRATPPVSECLIKDTYRITEAVIRKCFPGRFSNDEIKDIAQKAVVITYENRKLIIKGQFESGFIKYANRAAINLSNNTLRRKRKHISLTGKNGDEIDIKSLFTINPEDNMGDEFVNEVREIVNDYLDRISDTAKATMLRKIFRLRFNKGYKLSEIANEMSLDHNLVRRKYYRAIDQLRKILRKKGLGT